jgi:hypothetical protein
MPVSPQARTIGCSALGILCADAGSSCTWERTLLACPTLVTHDCLSSAGVTHDIIFGDVMKCQPFQEPAPAATLLERRKNKLNVARCGSIAAHLPSGSRLPRSAEKFKRGGMWGFVRQYPSPIPPINIPSPTLDKKSARCNQMSSCYGVAARFYSEDALPKSASPCSPEPRRNPELRPNTPANAHM